MMLRTLMLLFAANGAPAAGPLTPQQAVEKVDRCGVGPVVLRYDSELQSYILVIAKPHALTDDQLTCIDQAADIYDVELPPAMLSRFMDIRNARWSAAFEAEARNWLAARNLLDRVPSYRSGVTDDAEFARALEKLCGPDAEGALQSKYGHHILNSDWLLSLKTDLSGEGPMACLLNAAALARYSLGIIGNEQDAR